MAERGRVPGVTTPTTPAAPVTRRDAPAHPVRRRVLVTLGVVVAVVTLIAGGPWVYARFVAAEPRAPLALAQPTTPVGVTPTAAAAVPVGPVDVAGTWTIGEGSEAGYRLGEVLSGEQVTVVGRTDVVSGTLTVTGSQLTAAEVVVDVASVMTDESARDAYFRRALDTSTHPHATFRLTEPVDVSAVGTSTESTPLRLVGTLTLHGTEQAATVDAVARRTADGIEVLGSTPISLDAFGLTPPSLGFVTVDPAGTIEMLLHLRR